MIMFQVIRHMLYKYRDAILRRVFRRLVIKPLMEYREIEIIEEIIKNIKPKRCLEWGQVIVRFISRKF